MNIAMFYHSLVSDWNHGNAHFLRGVAGALRDLGHAVSVYEPEDGWSVTNLRREQGDKPIEEFRRFYPNLASTPYRLQDIDLDETLSGADLVLVHEWNDRDLIERIGAHRRRNGGYRLLFHDTHHRSVTDPQSIGAYDLFGYDGVLAYGRAIAEVYLRRRWTERVWVWHEAADTRIFRPRPEIAKDLDLVWVGNWGDGERSEELREFLLRPVVSLKLKAAVYGVRYPEHALREIASAGIAYGGWVANFRVPEIFARARATVHIPRRAYATVLPGIPTIRPFEALACGIPLVCAPWHDSENLFAPGEDFLCAGDSTEMAAQLRSLYEGPNPSPALARRGRQTILARHTCAHRARELLGIAAELKSDNAPAKTLDRYTA